MYANDNIITRARYIVSHGGLSLFPFVLGYPFVTRMHPTVVCVNARKSWGIAATGTEAINSGANLRADVLCMALMLVSRTV